MKKRYILDSNDLSITLEIDTALITLELAHQMNEFLGNASDCLDASDGDIYQVVACYAAVILLKSLINGCTTGESIRQLSREKGFLFCSDGGMTIIDYDAPKLSFGTFNVREIPV